MRLEPVNLHVAKVMSGYGQDDYVVIEVDDGTNGSRIMEIKLTLEEAAKAFLYNGHVEANAKYYDLTRIGQRREVKQVEFPDSREHHSNWEKYVEEQLADEINEGYLVRGAGRWNHHNSKDGVYRMTIVRFVDDNEN